MYNNLYEELNTLLFDQTVHTRSIHLFEDDLYKIQIFVFTSSELFETNEKI